MTEVNIWTCVRLQIHSGLATTTRPDIGSELQVLQKLDGETVKLVPQVSVYRLYVYTLFISLFILFHSCCFFVLPGNTVTGST